jgi:hypothetical protein
LGRLAKGHVGAAPNRGAATAALPTGLFGMAWDRFGAGGLPGSAAAAVRGASIAAGVVVIGRAARLRRRLPPSETTFASRRYWLVVMAEVISILAGAVGLGLSGNAEYLAPWAAMVVGVHFVAFGHYFHAWYYWLGAILVAGALAGA